MTQRLTAEHEALCRRCGRCCYEKFIIDNHVFTTRTPCQFLDVKNNTCKVYDHRFEANPRCLTVEQGIDFGVFPADCPYVKGLENYLPAEDGWLEQETVRKVERGSIYTYEQVRDEMNRTAKKNCAGSKPLR